MAYSHYGGSLHPNALLSYAEFGTEIIGQLIERHKKTVVTPRSPIPVLVYRGMSGVAHATALSLELHRNNIQHELVYVRKPEEDAHGSPVEFTREVGPSINRFYVFVDDFISTGTTFHSCVYALLEKKWVKETGRVYFLAEQYWGLLQIPPDRHLLANVTRGNMKYMDPLDRPKNDLVWKSLHKVTP